ncbi:hypothetical protein D3C76_78900 [compost metagenome]
MTGGVESIVTSLSPFTPDPSFAIAATRTIPSFSAVSSPFPSIIASPFSPYTDQVTDLSDASPGTIEAFICKVPSLLVIVDIPFSPSTEMVLTGIKSPS